MNEYVCAEDLDSFQDLKETDTDRIAQLRMLCEAASRQIDTYCRRRFYPRVATRYYDHPEYDDTVLKLDDDLLAVTALTTANAGTTLTASDYHLAAGDDWNLQPYSRIHMVADGNYPNLWYSGTPQRANAVTGTWGYHDDWDSAWQDSGDTLAAAITTAVATTGTVADADGANVYGIRPRFKVGQLLKIDSEYLYVTGVNASTNTLTWRRGMNGTTAATHLISSTVTIFQPQPEIAWAAKRLAAWLYAQRSAPSARVVETFGGGTRVTIPMEMPADVAAILDRFVKGD